MADARIAVVVGAGDYLGSAIAKRFAREGFTIAAGRRNGDELSPLVEAIADEGEHVTGSHSMRAKKSR